MRRELRPISPSVGFRLYGGFRTVERRVVRAIAARQRLGGHSWHMLQHHLSNRSSLEPDWLTRAHFYQASMSVGEGLCVFPGCVFHYPENIRIGKNVFMNRGVSVTAPAPVSIGDDVLIGPYSVINSGNHRYSVGSELIRKQGHELKAITIGPDCWIGAGVVVLPGVNMGRGSVAAAGAVVTRDVSEGEVVGGVPARRIGFRT